MSESAVPEPVKRRRGGMHHVGVATGDYDATVDFYTRVMDWEIAWQEIWATDDGVEILRHVFFDTGAGELFAFMCPTPAMKEMPSSWPTDINSGLGVEPNVYHFAFWADSVEELEERQAELRSRGAVVTEVNDHGWCSSIYFRDPNGLMLEYCATTRELTADDKILKVRYQPGVLAYLERPELMARDAEVMGVPVELPAPETVER
jgi:catechol 2,3-dioxygenase-like lactoylglutathione lyase family enzyme